MANHSYPQANPSLQRITIDNRENKPVINQMVYQPGGTTYPDYGLTIQFERAELSDENGNLLGTGLLILHVHENNVTQFDIDCLVHLLEPLQVSYLLIVNGDHNLPTANTPYLEVFADSIQANGFAGIQTKALKTSPPVGHPRALNGGLRP
jgi:hypothetical protein